MNLLLDTHALIWWLYSPKRLSDGSRLAITDRSNSIFVSAVTAYEVSNKFGLGKWPEVKALAEAFDSIVLAQSFIPVSIASSHAIIAGLFKSDHRDPFDRLIAAQAISIEANVVTKDVEISKLGAPTFW